MNATIEFHNRLSDTFSAMKGIEDWLKEGGTEEQKAFLEQLHDSLSLFETLRGNLARKIKQGKI